MMLKPKSGKSAWLKLAGVIPVTLISVSLFATQIENSLEFKDVTTAVTASEPNAGDLITVKDNDNKQSGNRESSKDEVFKKCDVMPEFPGGEAAFVNFISRNVKYPKVARENGIQGKVIVSFVIEKDGSV